MRTVGAGGSSFRPLNARGTRYSDEEDGLIVDMREQETAPLWLPDTANSTLVRWDTSGPAPRIAGTYRVGMPAGECPNTCCWDNGCNMASRVAVDDRGDAYVATIGFGIQGTVTKIAGNLANCVDRNADDRITTSVDGVALDYGQDECVLWTAPVGGVDALLRSLTIDIGDSQRPNGYVWVGAYNESRMYKLDPNTGAINGQFELDLAPFGAVVDGRGMLWVTSLGDASIQSLNTRTGAIGAVIENPQQLRDGCRNSYGSTVDQLGRIWMAGWECNDAIAYDPRTDTWCRVAVPGGRVVGRGLTVDHNNRIYAALGGDGQSGLAWWEADQCVANQTYNAVHFRDSAPNTLGASSINTDRKGRVWLSHYISPSLFRMSTLGGIATAQWDDAHRNYSFSDSTGLVRRNAIGLGTYTEDVEADCDAPTWSRLEWSGHVPDGADLYFTASTASQRDKLLDGELVSAGQVADNGGPVNVTDRLDAAGVVSRRFLRLTAHLKRAPNGETPVLGRFSMLWSCGGE
jgi:hypothetical protein